MSLLWLEQSRSILLPNWMNVRPQSHRHKDLLATIWQQPVTRVVPWQVADGCWRMLAVAVKLIAKTPWKQAQETGQWVKTSLSLLRLQFVASWLVNVILARNTHTLFVKWLWNCDQCDANKTWRTFTFKAPFKNVSCSGKAQLFLWRQMFFFSGLHHILSSFTVCSQSSRCILWKLTKTIARMFLVHHPFWK